MLSNIQTCRYYPGFSFFHHRNPLFKIIFLFLFLLTILFSNLIESIFLFFMLFLCLVISQVPWKYYVKSLQKAKVLFFCLFLLHFLCGNKIEQTVTLFLQMVEVILLSSLFLATTTPEEITRGLEQFFSPLKKFHISISELALSLSLVFRFLPELLEQSDKILKSQASRGVDYGEVNWKKKMMVLSSLLFPMFRYSFLKAEMVSDVMELRGYQIGEKRTIYKESKWTLKDGIILVILFLFLIWEVFYAISFNNFL